MDAAFTDAWMWAIFAGIGLLLVIVELILGMETGLDLVFIGSAFVLGGLISWPFGSWVVTVVLTSIICVAYLFLVRNYVRRRTGVKLVRTNVDAVIGKSGIVTQSIARNADGRVKIDSENWKARAGETINEGDEIIVKDIIRNTVVVEKAQGGN